MKPCAFLQGKTGYPEKADEVFQTITRPDVVSFSSMSKASIHVSKQFKVRVAILVNAYGLNGMGKEAIELFHRISVDTIDEWIYVCVLNACSHSGLTDNAQQIFERIPNAKRTEKIYTTLVSGDSILVQQILFDR